MAQLNLSGSSWATENLAWTNGPGASTQIVYFDDSSNVVGGVLQSGNTVYTDAALTTGTELDGLGEWWYYEDSNSVSHIVTITSAGVAGAPTTTTTTQAPVYTITSTQGTTVNEGDTFNVLFQYTGGGTTVLTLAGTATEVDFSTWPTGVGTGNTTATLDFTNATTVDLEFVVNSDLSSGEGDETIIFTLTDGTTETVTITDSSINQPPTISNITANTTQGNTVDINLSQNTTDPENNPNSTLTWVISSLPTNGEFYDGSTLITTVPTTLTGVTVTYDPGSSFQGAAVGTWYVNDPDSSQSNTANINITVGAPANQAPVANDINVIFQAPTTGIEKFFSRSASDEDINTLAFDWVTDISGNTVIADTTALSLTLSHGSVVPTSGQGFKYTTNTIVNPGGSTLVETFFYKATDSDGLSDTAEVKFQLTASSNTAPSFVTTPPLSAIQLDQASVWESSAITAFDSEGHATTITVENVSGTSTGVTTNFNDITGILSVGGATAGTIIVELKVEDEFGATDANQNVTYNFNVNEVAYRAVKKSVFSNSDSIACELERPLNSFYYYDTNAGTTTLSNLAIGAFLYQTSGLVTKIIPSSSSNTWLSLEEGSSGNATVKAIKLNATTGAIEQSLSCEVTGGAAWPLNVQYDALAGNYCDGILIQGEAWQNIGVNKTLTEVVAANGQLFASEYYANQYSGSIAPSELLLADGAYGKKYPANPALPEYYFLNGSLWQTNSSPIAGDTTNKLFICAPDIVYSTRELEVRWYKEDPANIGAVCNAQKGMQWANAIDNYEKIKIYYRQDVNDASSRTLLQLAKEQTLIYAVNSGALNVNYSLLQPSSILLDEASGGLVLWDNDNYTGIEGSFDWYAFGNSGTQDNILERAISTSVYGGCDDGTAGGSDADYSRPDIWNIPLSNTPISGVTLGSGVGSRNSLYHAFYACEAKLDPGVPGGSPYYPIYIVDGMANFTESNSNGISYINDFIKEVGGETPRSSKVQIKVAGQCVTYINSLIATNIEEAVSFMSAEIDAYLVAEPDVPAKPVSINAIDLGFASQASISYKAISLTGTSSICYECSTQTGGGWNTYTFPAIDDAEILNRTIPNFDLEENYILDNVSKPLLRTNPKLSTNAKIVANSTDQIFIESFDATKELASVEYKKWELNPSGDWSQDLYKFYKSSSTPSDIMYATKAEYSDFTVQDSFNKQIEELYHYGTTYNYSKLHDEELRMLAPIWLDKDIPNKFVVFRVNDPVGEIDFDAKGNFDNLQEILKNSEIIKTFDLTNDSSLGKYIRNHVSSESFPDAPVKFNFDREEKSSFKGIDLGKGGFTSKGEYLYEDFVRADNPLISSNALITGGFERNKLACANLMNLEFLFNDNNASDYSINRYFGLYVNDIDSGYGSLQSSDSGNVIFKSLNSHINESPESAIPSFKQISTTPTLGYLSISDKFYKISPKSSYDSKNLNVIVEDNANEISSEIKTAANGKSIDVVNDSAAGFDFVKFSVTGTPAINDRFIVFESRESAYSIKFLRHIPSETWNLTLNNGGHITTSQITLQSSLYATFASIKAVFSNVANIDVSWDLDEKELFITESRATLGDLEISFTSVNALTSSSIVKVTQIQTSVNLDNSTFFATHALEAGTFNSTSFSLHGDNINIARAIVGCINNSPINFDAILEDGSSDFYVKTRVKGYMLLQSGVLVPNTNASVFITLENRDVRTSLNQDGLLRLNSDVLNNNSIYYMSGGNSAGKSVLVTKDSVSDIVIGDLIPTTSSGVYNKVIDIVDDIERLNTIYKKLILEDVNTLESGEQDVYAENVAKLGLFSAYDIHDMNFDFYDRSNSDLKELEYETSELINYEPERSTENTYTVFGNDYDLTPDNYFTGISDILPEETLDEYNEIKLWSEYDRLEENNLKEFAVRSRIVPNINKWSLKDTLTVREQPYYLNANEAFGRTNFAPDFGAIGRDRLGMTHEWFYMDNIPKYLQYTQLNNTFSYVNFLDGFQLTADHFKSTSYNYFDKFMITDGFEVKDQYGIKSFIKTNLKKKYTKVSGGNDLSFASTVFKGIKVGFKNRKEFINNKATEFVKSSEFNDYKFSTLVAVRTGDDINDISYEIIQNKTFKFVIFLITVSIDDLWIDGALNRKLLYEMNDSFLWNHEQENFSYSDVNLTGSLNLNDINFSNPAGEDYLVAKGAQHADGGIPQFLDQINSNDENAFGMIQVKVTDSSGEVTFNLEIETVDDQDQITLAATPTDTNGNAVNVSNIAGYIQNSAEYVYKQGGKNAFVSILDQLAVANVNDLLKLNAGEIKYTTVDEDGNLLNNQFEIDFENGVEIIKESSLVTISDEDKPKTFKLKQGTIGYNLTSGDTYYPFLVRHNGSYTVDTKAVVTFTDTYSHFKTNTLQTTLNKVELSFEEPMYKHSLTRAEEVKLARDYYKRYNRCKTSFNLGFIQDDGTHDLEWGVIKNHFYRKVNEINSAGVTKLSSSTDKLPLYPLIGEVTIDKKDVNVFKSSWDKNYYTRSLSGGLNEKVPGTFETKEERSYLGSTIMKVKDSYNMTNFTTYSTKTKEQQDQILANSSEKYDIVLFEDKKYVYMDFYITNTVKKLLSQDGVLNSINKFVDAANSAGDITTTKDDALLYVENNLLNTFNLDIIKIYTSRIKGVASEVLSSESISNLDDGGFINDTNFTFKSHEQKPLNFRLIYNKRLGYSYRIRPMIKIQS